MNYKVHFEYESALKENLINYVLAPFARPEPLIYRACFSRAEDNDLALCLHFLPFIFRRGERRIVRCDRLLYLYTWLRIMAGGGLLETHEGVLRGRRKREGRRGEGGKIARWTMNVVSAHVFPPFRRLFEKIPRGVVLLLPSRRNASLPFYLAPAFR